MKLNLDNQFLDLKGNPLPDKMDEVLANMLAMSTTGNPAKMITWAVNLTNAGEIDINEKEMKFIAGLIKNSPHLTNLAKVQLLEEIQKLAEEDYSQDSSTQDDNICERVERDLMRKVNSLR